MNCPVCKTALHEIIKASLSFLVCSDCCGVWFSSGEALASKAKFLAADSAVIPEKLKLFQDRKIETIFTIHEAARRCPHCSQQMQKFNYSYDSNIFLDRCSNCGGVWADGGEIIQLASYLKEDPRIRDIGKGLLESANPADFSQKESVEEKIAEQFSFFEEHTLIASAILFFSLRVIFKVHLLFIPALAFLALDLLFVKKESYENFIFSVVAKRDLSTTAGVCSFFNVHCVNHSACTDGCETSRK